MLVKEKDLVTISLKKDTHTQTHTPHKAIPWLTLTFNPNPKPLVLSLCDNSSKVTRLKNPACGFEMRKRNVCQTLNAFINGGRLEHAGGHLHPHSFMPHGESRHRHIGESLATLHRRLVKWILLMQGLLLKSPLLECFCGQHPPTPTPPCSCSHSTFGSH